MSTTTKPTILLVHGAWHGSWCWKFQIPMLEALGYSVETVDLPCTSKVPGTTQSDDAAQVRSSVESLLSKGKSVIVLAHSYGGSIASAGMRGLSGEHNGMLLGLIALCAVMHPGGYDQGEFIRNAGSLPFVVSWDSPVEGLCVVKDPASLFYTPDVPADRIKWALPQVRPHSMAASMDIVPPQVWQDDHYTGQLGYIRCTADVSIPIERQDSIIEAAGGQERWPLFVMSGSSSYSDR
uniref:Methylesterase 1 n=1 Tax=Talaromyces marneffei PM1 TaxID=1077442 RepID=A0A093VIK6_TALMA